MFPDRQFRIEFWDRHRMMRCLRCRFFFIIFSKFFPQYVISYPSASKNFWQIDRQTNRLTSRPTYRSHRQCDLNCPCRFGLISQVKILWYFWFYLLVLTHRNWEKKCPRRGFLWDIILILAYFVYLFFQWITQ